MQFKDVATCFQSIETIDSRNEITEKLAHLFANATPEQCSQIAYLCLGELLPSYKKANSGMAEKSVTRLVARVLKISEPDAQKKAQELGDISLAFPSDAWQAQKEYSVSDVYTILLEITDVSGTGSQETKLDILTELLITIDSLSARYIIRILTGKLRLGFSDMTVLDALSWMLTGTKELKETLEQGYMVCADIGLIAKKARKEGKQGIQKLDIEIGIPLRPAAAERLLNSEEIMKKIGEACVAQPKLDGFRLQIHIDRTQQKTSIYFFSRNLTDMSEQFPDLHKELLNLPIKTVIFEGEAICYDTETGAFLPFQETAKRKRKYAIEEIAAEFPLQFFVFDILYLNGESLLAKPHSERRMILETLFKTFKNERIFLIEETECTNTQQLESLFLSVVSRGLEGLVVKKNDAPYLPGKRNFNWIKLKRKAQGRLTDTIDTVIIGYYFGKGKRTHFGIGSLLVAVFNKSKDVFQTIARVGTGLSDLQWKEIKEKIDAYSVKNKPHHIECASELEPDVWAIPKLVCIIKAEEITLSPLHRAGATDDSPGFALRFPRFAGIAADKSPQETTTTTEIQQLYHNQCMSIKK